MAVPDNGCWGTQGQVGGETAAAQTLGALRLKGHVGGAGGRKVCHRSSRRALVVRLPSRGRSDRRRWLQASPLQGMPGAEQPAARPLPCGAASPTANELQSQQGRVDPTRGTSDPAPQRTDIPREVRLRRPDGRICIGGGEEMRRSAGVVGEGRGRKGGKGNRERERHRFLGLPRTTAAAAGGGHQS
jgi:hypothetical protein